MSNSIAYKFSVVLFTIFVLSGLCFVAIKKVDELSGKSIITSGFSTWGLADPLRSSLLKQSELNSSDADLLPELSKVFASNNPLDPNAWLMRAKLAEGENNPLKKTYLHQATKLAWNRPVPLKKIYIEQLIEGDIGDAAATATRLLALRPNSANTYFFDLYALLGADEFYSSILLPALKDPDQLDKEALLSQFLKSAIKAKDDALIDKIWKLFTENPELESDRFKQYSSYLINQQDWPRLEEVWSSASNQDIGISRFADPEFEHVNKGGLCWKMTPVEGVSRTDNPHGIQLSFDGNHNLYYQELSCIVGVEPGSQYRLEYNWSGNKISTRSGMFVEATTKIDDKQISLGRSEARIGSWSLQSDQFEFANPQGSQIISVTIRRTSTSNLDNKLSGRVYFTGFKLEKLP